MSQTHRRKSNGFGHTYKVGNSWRTVIRYQGRIISASSPIKEESRKRAREKYLLAISHGNSIIATDKTLTVDSFFSHWLHTEHRESIAPSTYRRYSSLLKTHILPVIGKVKLTDLTRNDLSRVLSTMSQGGQSSRSQQQARAVLILGCREAFESGVMVHNPALGLRSIRLQSSPISPLTLDEVKRLLSTYSGTEMGARLHIALLCGLRQGEALGLRWSDIDLDSRCIRITQQMQLINGQAVSVPLKTTRSQRTIIMTDETVKELSLLKSSTQKNNGLVFSAENGVALSPHTDYNNWQRALKLCGIEPKRLHDARHTAATLMYSQGVGIETISRALGHSNSAITSRLYVHSAQEPLQSAANALQALLQ